MLDLDEQLDAVMPAALCGTVMRTIGPTAAVAGFPAPIGALAQIERQTGEPLKAEVIGFRDELTLLYPQSSIAGVRRGNRVRLLRTTNRIAVSQELLGRVVDANAQCIDGREPPALTDRVALHRSPPKAIERPRIDTPLSTGVRAVDSLLTCGKGQRLGIFSGSGVGKSVLLGMMARYTSADVNVIALVGERGREVNDFIERDLGPEGLAKSVVVVATSDEPALMRISAALTATALAEYFRDQGKDVLLLMDSVTRFAMAQREIGLAAGEPPTTRGYPPSAFALLPKMIERAGRSKCGSITGFYTVLVEGDDPNEPISDAMRGTIDGHVWLSRNLSNRGHYPAIDLLESISRLMPDITNAEQRDAAIGIRKLLATYKDHEDLISIGAYRRGSNPSVDVAIEMKDEIDKYLQQPVDESSTLESAQHALLQLHRQCVARKQSLSEAQAVVQRAETPPAQVPPGSA